MNNNDEDLQNNGPEYEYFMCAQCRGETRYSHGQIGTGSFGAECLELTRAMYKTAHTPRGTKFIKKILDTLARVGV